MRIESDLKGHTSFVLKKIGFLDTYGCLRRKITKSQIAILLYHRICPVEDSWSLKPLTPQSFENQIKYISNNFNLLSLNDLITHLEQDSKLTGQYAIITFDDGYRDNYTYAYPILRKYRAPATIFLSTGHIDTGKLFWWDCVRYIFDRTSANSLILEPLGEYNLDTTYKKFRAASNIIEYLKAVPDSEKNTIIYETLPNILDVDIPDNEGKKFNLTWDEVKDMNSHNIDFGAHSVNHPVLTNVPFNKAKWEIVQSKLDIEKRLGESVSLFSFPNGDFNPGLLKIVIDSGLRCAFASAPGKLVGNKDGQYQLSRIAGLDKFYKTEAMICGLYGDLICHPVKRN